jgi:hypothetical protein
VIRVPLALFLLTLATSAQAEPLKVSASLFVSMQAADVITTHNAIASGRAREANPFAQGGDGQRLAIKAATTGGTLWLVAHLDHHHPKLARGVLYTASGLIGTVAVNNWRLSK